MGDVIQVVNKDSVPHTVTNGKGPEDPNSGKLFDTSIINAGESAKVDTSKLTSGQQYPFHCTVHPYMTGTLKVAELGTPLNRNVTSTHANMTLPGNISNTQTRAITTNVSFTSNNPNYNYNIKPGSWVRYAISGPHVHSDNKFLELALKGILANPLPFVVGNMTDASSSPSLKDIEWFQINITRISGDNVTTQNEIKPYGKQPIIFKPVSGSLSNFTFAILPKNVQIGERFPSSSITFGSLLIVNRPVQKDIGGHNVAVYELTGQRNSFNNTSGSAMQTTVTTYNDKITGVPLQIFPELEVGSAFGTVNASIGFSAIDWSNRPAANGK
jgi:hypothetical protein